MYKRMVPGTDKERSPHSENGIALIKRTEWFNSHIEKETAFPRYKDTSWKGDMATRIMHPQSATVESGMAITLANKNSSGS